MERLHWWDGSVTICPEGHNCQKQSNMVPSPVLNPISPSPMSATEDLLWTWWVEKDASLMEGPTPITFISASKIGKCSNCPPQWLCQVVIWLQLSIHHCNQFPCLLTHFFDQPMDPHEARVVLILATSSTTSITPGKSQGWYLAPLSSWPNELDPWHSQWYYGQWPCYFITVVSLSLIHPSSPPLYNSHPPPVMLLNLQTIHILCFTYHPVPAIGGFDFSHQLHLQVSSPQSPIAMHAIQLIREFVEEHNQETQAREQHSKKLLDNNNACSIATIVPCGSGRVNRGWRSAAEHEGPHWSNHGVGQPWTPEPSLVGFGDNDLQQLKSGSHIPEDIIHCLETPANLYLCLRFPDPFTLNRFLCRVQPRSLNLGSMSFNFPHCHIGPYMW